ncbi:MAG: hypothetical protein ACOC4K_05175 [Verrucomicrobiota bacterium]
MAKLSDRDKAAFRELSARGWEQSPEECSPRTVPQTPEGRAAYIRWATEASTFFKGTKPVNFEGEHWML